MTNSKCWLSFKNNQKMNQWMVFIESKIFDTFGLSLNLIWLWGREKREKTKANSLHKIIDIRLRTNTKFFSSSMIFISTNSEKICSIFSIVEWKVEDEESSSLLHFLHQSIAYFFSHFYNRRRNSFVYKYWKKCYRRIERKTILLIIMQKLWEK